MNHEARNSFIKLQYYARLGVACILGGIGLIFVAMSGYRQLAATPVADWPTTKAVITESAVKETFDRRGKRRSTFAPYIRYRYEVEGQGYTGNRIRFHEETARNEADAWRIANIYPQQSEVTVYYDPSNPRQAYLSADGGGADWCTLACPGILVLLALGMFPWGGPELEEESILGV